MTRRAIGIVVIAALVLLAALIAGACSSGSHKSASSPTTTSPTTSAKTSTPTTSGALPSPPTLTPTPASPTSLPAPATVLACKVVTQAEASRLFGHPTVPDGATTGGQNECAWRYDDKVGSNGVVNYRLQVFAYRDGMQHSIDVVQNSQSNVSGSGSGNVTVRNSNDVDTVEAASNGKTVVLAYSVSGDNVPNPPKTSSQDAELHALARSAAARM